MTDLKLSKVSLLFFFFQLDSKVMSSTLDISHSAHFRIERYVERRSLTHSSKKSESTGTE